MPTSRGPTSRGAVLIATAPDGIAPREVLKRVEEALGHERFIALEDRRFTTKEIDHGIEGAALEAAQRLGEKHPSRVVSERRVEKAIRAEPRRNDCQKEAVRMVCQGADLTLIQAAPGSGKSALFAVACHAIEKDGGNVIGLTPSNRARASLRKARASKAPRLTGSSLTASARRWTRPSIMRRCSSGRRSGFPLGNSRSST